MKEVGDRQVWSIREISDACRRRFEGIPHVWVEAEVSNLREARNQVFFTLSEPDPGRSAWQVRCTMNVDRFATLTDRPRDGMSVQAYGRMEYYGRNVTLTFRVQDMAPVGAGLLRARIEALRAKLVAEGLIDPARKRPLPVLPRTVGIITSPGSAAEADIRRNIALRHPGISLVIVHSQVQGDASPGQVARSIRYLDAHPTVDVIVVARGGGPLEDLMGFNSEIVCRAVASAQTPIVSAIGHETDVTLCDLVADVRVSTPTKAAEAVVPDRAATLARLDEMARRLAALAEARTRVGRDALAGHERHMVRALATRGETARARLTGLSNRLLPSLRRRLDGARRDLADGERGLRTAMRADTDRRRDRSEGLTARLTGSGAALIRRRAAQAEIDLADRTRRLRSGATGSVDSRRTRLTHLGEVLDLLSPRRTVARGYAIVRDASTGTVRTRRSEIPPATTLDVELRDGTVRVRTETEGPQ